jgi:predicted ATPase/HPt (histidine-containing phosphotransfer) domain-containing protein
VEQRRRCWLSIARSGDRRREHAKEERGTLEQHTAFETVAVLPCSVLRRARRGDGSRVLLQSVRAEVTEPRQFLQRELEKRRQLGTLALEVDDVCELGGEPCLVFHDFVGGALVIPPGGLELGACLKLALALAQTLSHLHACGFLHGDLTPRALLVDLPTSRVELSELARVSPASADGSGELGGDPAYAAPERTGRVNRVPDRRSDYYSFGVTLFEMLTGRLPFQAADARGFAHAHSSKLAPLVSELRRDCPKSVVELVAKLLAKDPDERYQSDQGLLSDLRRLKETGGRESFVVGSRDVSRRFSVSRELLGRDVELAALESLCHDVQAGSRRLALVSGGAGAGKSALLAEHARWSGGLACRVLTGACEQWASTTPLFGLTRLLSGLRDELLGLPEPELTELRERVASALGHNAAIVTALVPALSLVTGSVVPVPELNPLDAQRRLRHALTSFVLALARPERPLLLLLDDCQWLDDASADALSSILTSPELGYVLVVAAFRPEADGEPPALTTLCAGPHRHTPDSVLRLQLGTLSTESVLGIVARTLRAPTAEVESLAALVARKTDGNPFFVGQFLERLRQQGALFFDEEAGYYRADLARVEACPASDNVGALTAARLHALSEPARQLLLLASCFGMRFELLWLAELAHISPQVCSVRLSEAVAQGLVAAETETLFAFEHSRVQQAALGQWSEAERIELHGRIGDLLYRHAPRPIEPSSVFELLQHLNLARGRLKGAVERAELCELNLLASGHALRNSAWNVADTHASIADELVRSGEEALQPELAFRALLARVETAFVSTDTTLAESLSERLLALAPDSLSRGRAHLVKTRILEYRGRLLDAIEQVRTALAELGVRLPSTPDEINQGIGEGLGKLQAHLGRVTVEGLSRLPLAEDPKTLLTLELLAQVVPSTFQACPPLFPLVELLMFDLGLSRGVSPVSCKNFADCGILLIAITGDHDTAYRLGLAAFELLKRFPRSQAEAGVSFVAAVFLGHWRTPYADCFALYDRAERRGLELGDVLHVAYARSDRLQRSFFVGARLSQCREQIAEHRRFLSRVPALGQHINTLVAERAVARLIASDAEREAVAAADAEADATVLAANSAQFSYAYGVIQLVARFILGDMPGARRFHALAKGVSFAAPGQFSLPDFCLFEALLALDAARGRAEGPSAEELELVAQNLHRLELWAQGSPANFAHKYHFLRAEQGRVTGAPLETVLSDYRTALKAAGDGFIHMRALILEHQSSLWLSLEQPLFSRAALDEAHRLYEAWGATAKLEQLERENPELLAESTGASAEGRTRPGRGVDEAALLKATQSIFVEVEPERLFKALMATLIEEAGAEHGCLVLRDDVDRQYYVEARAHVEHPSASLGQRERYEQAESLCVSVVSYVLRTGESVVLDDALARGAFRSDPRVQRHGVRSVMCVPILRQGDMLGVLYVENSVASYAFTHERTTLLRVIASQAAVSIYNAELYESLERRVSRRTEELAAKNRQVATMLDNLEQGVFTIGKDRRVEPEFSRHLSAIFGRGQIAGRDCVELLAEGSTLSADARSAASAALGASFGLEPWLAAVNSDHLIHEVERKGPDGEPQLLEVSWSAITDEQGKIEKQLVTVRDATLLRSLRQAARDKDREIGIVVEVLERGVQPFRELSAQGHALLDESIALVAASAGLRAAELEAVMRQLHTLKGNARFLGLSTLVDALHHAEDACAAAHRNADASEEPRLRARLDAARALLFEYDEVCERKLAPMTRAPDGAERALQELSALVTSVRGVPDPRALLQKLREIVRRAATTSVMHLLNETGGMLPSLSAELGKPAPELVIQPVDALLDPQWVGVLRDALIQCLRNAVYHGIEEPAARAHAGKPEQGRIRLQAESSADAFELRLSDDGRGLALDELRSRFAGAALSDDDLAEHIFASGVSTAKQVGLVAGRGVGLHIVRTNLRGRGGDVRVVFTGEARDGYRPFALLISIPLAAVLGNGALKVQRPWVPAPALG